MFDEQLFEKILLNPIKKGADNLKVISGYATSAMAFHHLHKVQLLNHKIQVRLVVGMTPNDGVSLSNHRGFQKIMTDDFQGSFKCSYILNSPPVHSKLYVWSKSGKPFESFVGSANYTQRAFISKFQKEIISPADPDRGMEYFEKIDSDSVFCTHQDAKELVALSNKKESQGQDNSKQVLNELPDLVHVKVTFINRYGEISQRSSLNWGQRPEERREPNQAYIPLKSKIYSTDFFPPVGQHFTVLTDDDEVLICSRAQQNGKAIHTPHNNSFIGEYFRDRLEVSDGNAVLREHFDNYGRVDVDFYKIDGETYFMDFSKPNK